MKLPPWPLCPLLAEAPHALPGKAEQGSQRDHASRDLGNFFNLLHLSPDTQYEG